jgi:hypothetical protein
MGHKDSDHKRNQQGISVEDDDFNRMDDAQPLAEGVLIVHTVKKRVIGCKHAINYMGIQPGHPKTKYGSGSKRFNNNKHIANHVSTAENEQPVIGISQDQLK